MTNHTNQKYDQTAIPIHSTTQQEQQQVQSQVPPSDTIQNSPPTSPNAREDLTKPISDNKRVPDMNESDDHVVATGAGTVGGAAVGAVAGLVGGPPGALVGGLIGGVLGVSQVRILPKGIILKKTNIGESNINTRLIMSKVSVLMVS